MCCLCCLVSYQTWECVQHGSIHFFPYIWGVIFSIDKDVHTLRGRYVSDTGFAVKLKNWCNMCFAASCTAINMNVHFFTLNMLILLRLASFFEIFILEE